MVKWNRHATHREKNLPDAIHPLILHSLHSFACCSLLIPFFLLFLPLFILASCFTSHRLEPLSTWLQLELLMHNLTRLTIDLSLVHRPHPVHPHPSCCSCFFFCLLFYSSPVVHFCHPNVTLSSLFPADALFITFFSHKTIDTHFYTLPMVHLTLTFNLI